MIGWVMIEPVQPVLSSVNVPPWMSSRRSFWPRDCVGELADRRFRPWMLSAIGVLDDRHDEPVLDGHGDPQVDCLAAPVALFGVVGVEVGVFLERLDGGLGHERVERQADAFLRLVRGPWCASRSATTPHMSISITVYATGTASALVICAAIALRIGEGCLSESPSATGEGA